MIEKPFIFIAQSHRNDFVPWMAPATVEAMLKPGPYLYNHEGHVFDIGRGRQYMAELFLKTTEGKENAFILYIDDDIVVPKRESLNGMYQWLMDHPSEGIISGLYYKKAFNPEPIIMGCDLDHNGRILFTFPFRNKPIPEDSVIKVGIVPAGFLLIRREVFLKIPPPWFVLNDPQFNQDKAISASHMMGEDVYFSLKAREHEFSLWIDTRADLLHYNGQLLGNQVLAESMSREASTMLEQNIEAQKKYDKHGV